MTLEKNLKFNLNEFSVPGKTFLVGEYAVLAGGSCLGLATKPQFSISLDPNGQKFHSDSAAGMYLEKNHFENFNHIFTNPYKVGGFGASTAEFIFSYYLNCESLKDLKEIFHTYLDLYMNRKEQRPSGADLLTQLVGGISSIDLSSNEPHVTKLSWNFQDLDFLIFSTGLKVKTHEHLAELDRKICNELVKPSQDIVTAFKTNDSLVFTQALSEWSNKLQHLGLTAPQVVELKNYLQQQIPDILVKPCGALGADVIIILCTKQKKQHVLKQIQSLNIKGLHFQADSSQLVNGPLSI